MNFKDKITLGRTGLKVGRLGISSSFGAPAEEFEEAYEKGCNYFSWGTFIKGRSKEMKKSIINILKRSQRDQLVLSMYTYAHHSYLTEAFFIRGLKALGIEFADILVLGYFPKRPNQKIIDGALKLKNKGLVHFLGVSSHHRRVFAGLFEEGLFDVYHIRYNAAHRGAETDTFPFIKKEEKPGIVSFTTTRWGQLLNPKKMPENMTAPSAIDSYRFVLSNPAVDICMMGAKNSVQMRENLQTLEHGPMNEEELTRMKIIGDYLYKK